ncbi:MAG: hypothetical protein AAFY97_08700 [Pseudomonadota bacterium]
MMALFAHIQSRIDRRRAYNRTVAELKSMPLDVALDLNLYQGDAERIAAEAVYGR